MNTCRHTSQDDLVPMKANKAVRPRPASATFLAARLCMLVDYLCRLAAGFLT